MTDRLICSQRRQRRAGQFRNGTILVVALVTLLVVMLLAGAIVRSYLQAYRQLRADEHRLQAQWLAEGALARAVARLRHDANYQGETWQVEIAPEGEGLPAKGLAIVTVAAIPDRPAVLRLEVQARYPNDDPKQATTHRTFDLPQPSDK